MAAAVPSTDNSTSNRLQNQNYFYNEYHEGILEIAKGFLNILLNQLLDQTMVAAVKEKWVGMFMMQGHEVKEGPKCICYYCQTQSHENCEGRSCCCISNQITMSCSVSTS